MGFRVWELGIWELGIWGFLGLGGFRVREFRGLGFRASGLPDTLCSERPDHLGPTRLAAHANIRNHRP